MLAARRAITAAGTLIRTPIVVPSFSSKGFPKVQEILGVCQEVLTDSLMVSAYDISKGLVTLPDITVDALLVDSGGYESSKDVELSDLGYTAHTPDSWSREDYRRTLTGLTTLSPTIAVCYDHPHERCSIAEQIERAKEDLHPLKGFAKELLLKPVSNRSYRVDCDEIVSHVHAYADFDVLGLTEKELGNSLLDRMTNVAIIRRALRSAEIDIPMHVFGSLDPISSPLYFLAGADIFDGLSWLRFAFVDGIAIYKHNYGALQLGIAAKDHLVDAEPWGHNIRYLMSLTLDMRQFLHKGDYSVFGAHADFFKNCYETVAESVGED
jgi:hypothetical protein